MPKIYGYARCSTNEDKQDISRQMRELEVQGADIVYQEYVSGSDNQRPELLSLFKSISAGDTLVATEVSRLTRSLHHLCHIVEAVKEKGIKLVCGPLVLDFTESKTDPVTLAMLYVMGVFAELERGMTVERIKSGLENAKANGVKVGRPKTTSADVPKSVLDLLPEYQAGKLSKIEYSKKAGITRSSLYKYLRLLGEI